MDIAALVVAGLAPIVSIVAAGYTRSQADSSRRLAEIEEDRRSDETAERDAKRALDAAASLHITPVTEGRSGVTTLHITNTGNHGAENLTFAVESLDEFEPSSRMLDLFERLAEFMRSGEYFLETYPHSHSAKVVRLTATWTDRREGRQQEVWDRLDVG